MSENCPQNNYSEIPLSKEEPTLLFLPGLGADRRLFETQSVCFPTAIVFDWLPLYENETIDEYARRLAESLPEKRNNYIVCGDSLGGMIAPRVAKYLNARTCVLVSSIGNPGKLRRRDHVLCGLAVKSRTFFYLTAGTLKAFGKLFLPVLGLFLPKYRRAAVEQLLDTPLHQFYGMLKLLYGAMKQGNDATQYITCPIIYIHGSRDSIIPIKYVQQEVEPDYILDGGHLIIMSHAAEINEILAKITE